MPLPPPPPTSGPQPSRPPGGPGTAGGFNPPSGPPVTGSTTAPSPSSERSPASVCYRHGDRETGRRCTRCGKYACNSCLVQATVGSHCVDCAKAARPDVAQRARNWSAGQHSLVTTVLIGINVAVFVGILLWTRDARALSGGTTAHLELGVGLDILRFDGLWRVGDDTVRTSSGEWYRLVTSGFVHYGLLHLAFNVFAINTVGSMVERALNRWQFLLLYAASLLGGSLGAIALEGSSVAAGASGAGFGLIAATATWCFRRGLNPLNTPLRLTFILAVAVNFVVPNVSIGGHLGGAAAGALCALVMLAPGHKAFPRWATYAAPIAVGVGSVVASVLLVATA